MEGKLMVLSFIIISICCLSISLIAEKSHSRNKKTRNNITGKSGLLKITIDSRLELLAIIQYLSGSKMVNYTGDYAKAVDAWFIEYKDHPVIRTMKNMESAGYSYDLPVSSFLLFDDYTCKKKIFNWVPSSKEMNLERIRVISQKVVLDDFYNMVGQFAQMTDFLGFFSSQEEYYQKLVSDAEDYLNKHPDMIAHMVNWYGYSYQSYTLVISPLVIGGYGPSVMDQEDGVHTYCVVSIDFSRMSERDINQVSSWFFHEFSHSFINPLVEEHWVIFKRSEAKFEHIADKMEKQAYDSWWITVAEHFVRASDIRLSELYYSFYNSNILAGQESQGFIFITSAYKGILNYEEAHLGRGINYANYFPTLAQYFVDKTVIYDKELDNLQQFQGPINSVFADEDILVIYPDPNRVEGVEENVIPTVVWLQKNMGYEAVTDKIAIEMDLSQRNLCIYGAWENNLILDKFKKNIPFEIYPDKILADKKYMGKNLRIALCLPNPLNIRKGMCIYTAQTIIAMKNANAIYHGPEDWYVSNTNLKILASGNFKNKNGDWTF